MSLRGKNAKFHWPMLISVKIPWHLPDFSRSTKFPKNSQFSRLLGTQRTYWIFVFVWKKKKEIQSEAKGPADARLTEQEKWQRQFKLGSTVSAMQFNKKTKHSDAIAKTEFGAIFGAPKSVFWSILERRNMKFWVLWSTCISIEEFWSWQDLYFKCSDWSVKLCLVPDSIDLERSWENHNFF